MVFPCLQRTFILFHGVKTRAAVVDGAPLYLWAECLSAGCGSYDATYHGYAEILSCKTVRMKPSSNSRTAAIAILVHMQYEICELNLHDEFSHHYFLLAHVSLDRPCRVGRQRNSQRAMWFIASGLQPSKNGRRKNCAVEFQSALSAQQS